MSSAHCEPSVGVIITSYNYLSYIREAIESVLAQSSPVQQLVVVDDASTDGSWPWLQEHYADHDGVTLVANGGRGQLAAFQRGLQELDTDIVAFLDADDYWEPAYVQRLREIYQQRPEVDFIAANLRLFGVREGTEKPVKPDRMLGVSALRAGFRSRWVGCPTSALSLKRSYAERIRALPEALLEDWRTRADDCLVYASSIYGANKYHLSSEVLVNYRQHDANLWAGRRSTRADKMRYFLRRGRLLKVLREQAGLEPELMRFAHKEFQSIERPNWAEFGATAELLLQSQELWWFRWRQVIKLFFRMLKS